MFETARFSGQNPNAPSSEELVRWLGETLKIHGVALEPAHKTDRGSEFGASHGKAKYMVTANSVADQWTIAVERKASFGDKLLGKAQMAPTDPFVWLIENALQGEPDIRNVRRS
jgi:hypothetical protein